jgi:hypothetical protein
MAPVRKEREKPWERAVRMFFERGFKHGDVVSKEWLIHAFAMDKKTNLIEKMIKDKTPPDEIDRKMTAYAFEFMGNMSTTQRVMLSQYSTDLQAMGDGTGYQVVPIEAQTARAYKDTMSAVHRSLKKGQARVSHIKYDQLSSDRQRENDNVRSKLTNIQNILRKEQRDGY